MKDEKKMSREAAEQLLSSWRKLANDFDYKGLVAFFIREGYTVRGHALRSGPCVGGLAHLEGQAFLDEPTKNCIAFWVPRMVPESTYLDIDSQRALCTRMREDYSLLGHHCADLGTVTLLTALIHGHFRCTGEVVPLNGFAIRTTTLGPSSDRESAVAPERYYLKIGFYSSGLFCDVYGRPEGDDRLGFFPLGIEELPTSKK